jgi:hypothetical protein
MSSPFSRLLPIGQFKWTLVPTIPGNFSPVNVLGMTTIPEVGYGQGGYGIGGYDAPASTIPGSVPPNWTTGSSR